MSSSPSRQGFSRFVGRSWTSGGHGTTTPTRSTVCAFRPGVRPVQHVGGLRGLVFSGSALAFVYGARTEGVVGAYGLSFCRGHSSSPKPPPLPVLQSSSGSAPHGRASLDGPEVFQSWRRGGRGAESQGDSVWADEACDAGVTAAGWSSSSAPSTREASRSGASAVIGAERPPEACLAPGAAQVSGRPASWPAPR